MPQCVRRGYRPGRAESVGRGGQGVGIEPANIFRRQKLVWITVVLTDSLAGYDEMPLARIAALVQDVSAEFELARQSVPLAERQRYVDLSFAIIFIECPEIPRRLNVAKIV